MMESETLREEVQRLLHLLRNTAGETRRQAAAALQDLGVRVRGGARIRGAVTRAAAQPIAAFDLTPALEALTDAQWEVRREVACALGQWGDELAIEALSRLVHSEPEWRVRVAVADALADIGESQAVESLTSIARRDPHEEVRVHAIEGLGRLALNTWPVLATHIRQRGAVRTRGGIRVRGASPSKRISPEADAILALLDQTRSTDPSARVRAAADDALGSLDE